jgi:hypothetical protein
VVSVFVGARQVAGEWWGKVEGNPSRLLDPEGCSLAPLDAFEGAVETMAAAAESVTRSREDVDSWRLRRVDLARDFSGIRDVGWLIAGLDGRRRKYARRQFVYNDPQRGAAETLFVGSRSGGARLYDQHAAYAEKGAEPGAMRWEVEARGDWLGRAGMSTVTRWTKDRAAAMAAERWDWSEMGATVQAPVDAIELVRAALTTGDLKSPGTAYALLGFLLVERDSRTLPSSDRTVRRLRAKARDLGVYLEPGDTPEVQVARRLDLAAGREVAA